MSVSTLSVIFQELDCLHLKGNMLGSLPLANDLQEDGDNFYELTTTCEFVQDLPSEDQQYQLADTVDKLGEEILQLRLTDKGLDEKGGGCKRPVDARRTKDEVDGPTKRAYQMEQQRGDFHFSTKSLKMVPQVSPLGVPQGISHPIQWGKTMSAGWPGGSEISSPMISPNHFSGQGSVLYNLQDKYSICHDGISGSCTQPPFVPMMSESSNYDGIPSHHGTQSPLVRTISGCSSGSSCSGSKSGSFSSIEDESGKGFPLFYAPSFAPSVSLSPKDVEINKILKELQSPLPSSSSAISTKHWGVRGPPDDPKLMQVRGPPQVVSSNENSASLRDTISGLSSMSSSIWRHEHASPVTSPRSLFVTQPSPESYPLPPTPISPDSRTLSPDPSPHSSPAAYAGCSGPPSHVGSPRDGSVLSGASRSPPLSDSLARDELATSSRNTGLLHSIPGCLPSLAAPVQGHQRLQDFSESQATSTQQWSPASSSSEDSLTAEDITAFAIGEDKQWRQDEYGDTYLHVLVSLDDEEAAEQLNILLHAKVSLRSVIDKRNNETETPLYSAVEMGRTELTRQLLKCGANVNLACRNRTMNSERTPLHVAVEKGYIDIVKILSSCDGVDVDAPRRPDNYTPLMVALEKHRLDHPSDDRSDIIQHLIEEGADLTAKDGRSGNTVLMMAVAKKDVATVQCILDAAGPLEARKLVQQQSMCGNSALHVAAGLQSVSEQVQQQLFRLLIKSGGDTELKNNEGDTPRNFNRNLLTRAGRMK